MSHKSAWEPEGSMDSRGARGGETKAVDRREQDHARYAKVTSDGKARGGREGARGGREGARRGERGARGGGQGARGGREGARGGVQTRGFGGVQTRRRPDWIGGEGWRGALASTSRSAKASSPMTALFYTQRVASQCSVYRVTLYTSWALKGAYKCAQYSCVYLCRY